MDHVDFFNDFFDYRRTVLLMLLFKDDIDILNEYGFFLNNFIRLCAEVKSFLNDQIDNFLNTLKPKKNRLLDEILRNKWKPILLQCWKLLQLNGR